MLPYIILSYVIIKNLLYTTTLLLFYIINPILNYLNLLFNNNIQLNITLINSVQNNNIKEKTIINIKDKDNIEELESLKDDSSTYEDDETEDEKDETKDEKDETKEETKEEIKDDKNETKDDKKISLFEKALFCNHKKFHQEKVEEKKSYSFFDYFFTKTNKLKDTNNEDVILVDETL
jgi:hypothetical protein